MKRPTRVPASSVVRMNNASNMMAKWYHSDIAASPPSAREKRWAIPTARLGAPPVRESSEFSPTWRARVSRSAAEMVLNNAHPLIVSAALIAVVPITAAGELIAK